MPNILTCVNRTVTSQFNRLSAVQTGREKQACMEEWSQRRNALSCRRKGSLLHMRDYAKKRVNKQRCKQQKISEFIKKIISQEMGDSAGKEANNLRGISHFHLGLFWHIRFWLQEKDQEKQTMITF